ncbi:host-nuclease inhibitor Gam family protein [uncultured Desulfuromusa sp.]|uniref:host-nuclease inhibitor Gam family protein n=1 Tax=uncultured Desulfuromusa sp. TaxID=219183 RepID=UPI002AA92F42|nr:host-nuclease inhibitor Gam family protein [uncultured Desulfuromusa sp.]
MAKKVKQQAVSLKVPQSHDETVEYIAEVGRLQRERERIQAAMNDEIAAIKQRYEEQAQPIGQDIKQLSEGVQIWCEANRAQLTNNGKVKFAQLASGKINWRMRPPKVSLRGKEAIIDACKQLGLTQFIRTVDDINKEAMLADQDKATKIQGVSITQVEDFVITPYETELEEVA